MLEAPGLSDNERISVLGGNLFKLMNIPPCLRANLSRWLALSATC